MKKIRLITYNLLSIMLCLTLAACAAAQTGRGAAPTSSEPDAASTCLYNLKVYSQAAEIHGAGSNGEDYLTKPVCPSGGSYTQFSDGTWTCSVHGSP